MEGGKELVNLVLVKGKKLRFLGNQNILLIFCKMCLEI